MVQRWVECASPGFGCLQCYCNDQIISWRPYILHLWLLFKSGDVPAWCKLGFGLRGLIVDTVQINPAAVPTLHVTESVIVLLLRVIAASDRAQKPECRFVHWIPVRLCIATTLKPDSFFIESIRLWWSLGNVGLRNIQYNFSSTSVSPIQLNNGSDGAETEVISYGKETHSVVAAILGANQSSFSTILGVDMPFYNTSAVDGHRKPLAFPEVFYGPPGFDDPDHGWDSFDDEKKARIYAQLRMFISELRALPPPASPAICSILRGPVWDHRLCKDVPYGPYPDEAEMNRQLRAGADLARYHNLNPRVVEAHSIRHPLVFTHGDLAMRNIMVEGDVVTGIIDWECAGWFPAHWEYVKARFACVLAYEKAWKEGVAETLVASRSMFVGNHDRCTNPWSH
ncbi:hypothetical protein A0H81_01626 [Grifola frondosa]|uniref:Aminoglycoside phosphotransferase domain-containing protein n=1 Tax=Grifola frondosa TaxID=5627 RepID=A0A1C7MJV6_GRIFR|nr:hypothetical protein A0H81_01626 [Grifola frondosa]